MQTLPFNREHDFVYGELETLAPGLRRITARNPGPMSFRGTGTYVLGEQTVCVVDPGPADPMHINALLTGLGRERITQVLITHTHLDHSPGTALLREHADFICLGMPTKLHDKTHAAASNQHHEFNDLDFRPDLTLRDEQRLEAGDWSLRALHTPGHASNHFCFVDEQRGEGFVGDLLMAWSTTVIHPPDGELRAYLQSLERIKRLSLQRLWPTHGAPIDKPTPWIDALIRHRHDRLQQILDVLKSGAASTQALQRALYGDVDPSLQGAALASLTASLEYLDASGEITLEGACWQRQA